MATVSVGDVQKQLNALGANPPLTVDGDAGPITQAAIKAFQSSKGLAVDGIVGPVTLAALGFQGATTMVPGLSSQAGNSTISDQTPSADNSVGLKASVLSALSSLFGQWEGSRLPYMYTDMKGLVTTGTGDLIDPIGLALSLPWRMPDGSLASQEQITADWNAVKANGPTGPGHWASSQTGLTTVRLDSAGLSALDSGKIQQFYAGLKSIYPNFDSLPADAQMAMLSNSWAWGEYFHRVWDTLGLGPIGTQFRNAILNYDFITASQAMAQANAHEINVKGNKGLAPRDAANQAMFRNAANVVKSGAGWNNFFYPNIAPIVASGIGIAGALLVAGSAFLAWKMGWLNFFFRA